MSTNKLYVGGLPFGYTEEDLRCMCEKFGDIEDAFIVMDKTYDRPKSKGFGFVTFVDPACASDCVKALDNTDLEGRVLAVEFAKSATGVGRGGRRGGGNSGRGDRRGPGVGGFDGRRGGRGGRGYSGNFGDRSSGGRNFGNVRGRRGDGGYRDGFGDRRGGGGFDGGRGFGFPKGRGNFGGNNSGYDGRCAGRDYDQANYGDSNTGGYGYSGYNDNIGGNNGYDASGTGYANPRGGYSSSGY